jgi:hypothetical protein
MLYASKLYTSSFLRNVFFAPTFELSANRSTTMVDRSGLKFVGFIFATVTVAVMSMTILVVKGNADGTYVMENSAASIPSR